MSNKQLVNNVTLSIDDENPRIELDLSIPIKVENGDLKKLKGKKDVDLGTISFSEKTSDLIRQVGEEIRKELFSKL